MNQKFSKKELERLGCNEEEVKLVMEYQKKLPIIVDNVNIEEFSVDARILHKQLGVKKKFSTWIKSNLKDYLVNVDYIISSPRETDDNHGKFINEEEYFLTLGLAKEIAMYTGRNSQASNELKETSRIVRKYFILMEKVVHENKQWLEIRDPEKEEYKNMSFEVDAWMLRVWHKKASKSVYSVEADGINKIVTGLTSQELKLKYNCPTNELIRDYLKKDHNEELLFLERQNQVLLRMNMGYTDRMNMLNKMHNVTFKENKVRQTA
jgi:phage anti-repressor protein